MGVTRISSRLSHRRVAQLRLSQKAKIKAEQEEKDAIKRKRKPMDVHIQTMAGRSFTLAVSPDDTLDEVSLKIKMKEGINPDQQVFLFNGKTLQMDDIIDDYHIEEYSTIFLRLRNIGG